MMILATGVEEAYAVLWIISIALIASGTYLAIQAAKKPLGDDTPTTISTRGEYIPVVIGKRRIGFAFGQVWGRKSKSVSAGGKGSSSSGSQKNWRESAWHILCPGPGHTIHSIFANGKRIWKTDITRAASPSGTGFTVPDFGGVFYVYWGEEDQPSDPTLAAHIGFASQNPGIFHIVWKDFQLGASPQWPQIEYVVSVFCEAMTLNDSASLVTDGTSATGVNLAHAILQVACSPYPFGGGLTVEEVDNDSLEALGVLMESEQIGVNMLISGNSNTSNEIKGLLQDAGTLMPQVQGRLAFVPLRHSTDAVPEFNENIIMPPDFERDINHGENDVQRIVFTFKNEQNLSYRDNDIKFDDDGEVGEIGKITSTKATISTVTARSMADKISRRRSQEASVLAGFKVNAIRGASRLLPGQRFFHSEFGNLRVMSVLPKGDSPEASLEVAMDIYSVPDTTDGSEFGYGDPGGIGLGALDDLGFTWFQLPSEFNAPSVNNPSGIEIVVFRTRAHSQMEGSQVLASVNSGSYSVIGTQDGSAAGGLISDTMDGVTAGPIVAGPIFEDDNGDADTIVDLTGDDPSWTAGSQIAVIGDEVFFAQSVTAVGETVWVAGHAYSLGDYVIPSRSTGFRYRCVTAGTSGGTEPGAWPTKKLNTRADGAVLWEARYYSYRISNMIRAQYGTSLQAHSVGDRVYIISQSDLTPLSALLFASGANVCVKTQPNNRNEVATTATPVCKDLT